MGGLTRHADLFRSAPARSVPAWSGGVRAAFLAGALLCVGAEKLGDKVDLSLTFTDSDANTVRLGNYFDGKKPVVLALVYFDCPIVCPLVLDRMAGCFDQLDYVIGRDFNVVVVSFNPGEGPTQSRARKERDLDEYAHGRSSQTAAGWGFHTGTESNIAALADQILARHSRGLRLRLDRRAMELLEQHPWPGNVRELENVLARASVFCRDGIIREEDLVFDPSGNAASRSIQAGPAELTDEMLAGVKLEELERRAITATLQMLGGNKAKAARVLGISERSVYNKIARWSLPF